MLILMLPFFSLYILQITLSTAFLVAAFIILHEVQLNSYQCVTYVLMISNLGIIIILLL